MQRQKKKKFFRFWKQSTKITFSKRMVRGLLIIGAVNGTLPFVLAAFDKQPVAEMGIAWVTEVVAVITGYLCKSYFETKQERKQNLEDFKEGLVESCKEEAIVDDSETIDDA